MAALLWTAFNVGGMALFGPALWQSRADGFAVAFATLGRVAPLRLDVPAPPFEPALPGRIGLVTALLAGVIFDGLHAGPWWAPIEAMLHHALPALVDINGHIAGTLGLLTTWLFFVLSVHIALGGGEVLARREHTSPRPADLRLPARLAIALVPIAAGYQLAHNVASLAQQAPVFVQLLSDPFGWQWDLFGTARRHGAVEEADARTLWFVAVGAIVAGHVVSIVLAHRIALRAGLSPRRAALVLLPLTALMVVYTAVSLLLIAAPMTQPPPADVTPTRQAAPR